MLTRAGDPVQEIDGKGRVGLLWRMKAGGRCWAGACSENVKGDLVGRTFWNCMVLVWTGTVLISSFVLRSQTALSVSPFCFSIVVLTCNFEI